MLFTSYTFILFIAIVFLVYYIIPAKFGWKWLLLVSYIFYAYAGIHYLLFILFTTITTYFIGNRIQVIHDKQSEYIKENKSTLSREDKKKYKQVMKSKRWKWLLLCLILNIGLLCILKYTDFVIANINSLFSYINVNRELTFFKFILPMGISFYTFQTMGYIIDVYPGKYPPEKNIFKLALFVSFFPQMVQGPISRFDDLSVSLFENHKINWRNISFGLQRILYGYFKKLVIADRILIAVNSIIRNPEEKTGVFVLIGMVFYATLLYCDFTGGIDITIGIAEVLGIKVKENFERPFFSKSIEEYWRRWHITMGTWFKDYIFYPISVCKPMLNLSTKSRAKLGDQIGKRIPVYLSTLVVWFTTGLWHGASWNFIMWGVMNGVVIIISQEFKPFYKWFHNKFNVEGKTLWKVFCIVRTFWLMCFLRAFDCYRDVNTAYKMMWSAVSTFNFNILFNGSLLDLGLGIYDYIIIIIGVIILITVSLIQRTGSVREKLNKKPIIFSYLVFYILLLCIIIFGAYGIGYDASQFIYNQF